MSARRIDLSIALSLTSLLTAGCHGVESREVESLSFTQPIRVAAIGADMGRRTAYQIFAEGDLPGSITHVTHDEFNSLSVEELRASYDVLLFTFATSSKLDADFDTRLRRFLEQGGGVVFEDAGNTSDLAPGAQTAPKFPFMGTFRLDAVPGLTNGVTDEFPHNHMAFNSWDARLAPLVWINRTVVGLYGGFPGGGRMVVTGTDQHQHGNKYSTRASERNQYTFLRNELCWAAGCVNQPPVAKTGGDSNIECTGALTQVQLDASGSSDTDRDVLAYLWTGPFGSMAMEEPLAMAEFPFGEHHVTLAVSDTHGATSTDSAVIRIQDTVAPAVHLNQQTSTIWSPDHKMVLAANASALDACDRSPSFQLSVTSDEPTDSTGDGNTAPDWRLDQREDGSIDLWLRAERIGSEDGRTYTITVTAWDASGNTAATTAQVQVGHTP